MLFQTQGGLPNQILETISALNRRGVEAELIDPNRQALTDFDVVHVYSAINGNHRIVEQAHSLGLPVVTSPLLQPSWSAWLGKKARLIEKIIGKITQWEIQTNYHQIETCLTHSDHLIALGKVELNAMTDAFCIDWKKISVVPNGVPEQFFNSSEELIATSTGITAGYVLSVAAINSYKNQLALAQASSTEGMQVVLVGQCLPLEQHYLEKCLSFPHVKYLGKLNYYDPLLPSAYAAASVFCLPSQSEVMPLTILESLAAGTPVVTTRHHCMDLEGFEDVLIEVDPNDLDAIRKAISHFMHHKPSRERCQAAVRRFTWDAVAEQINGIYEQVFADHSATRSKVS